MKHRSKLLQVYSNFVKMVETQFSKCIKIFLSNNALEYTQYGFQAVLHSYGTVYQLTCLGSSQQNCRTKRKFRHILDIIHALLLSTKVPTPFWGKAALHAVHTINRIPSPVIQNQTPYDSACFVFLQPYEYNKLEPRSRLCCFLGYGETQKGYRCYDFVSHPLYVSRNVVFWEHHSFVELSHFLASLSSSFVLDHFLEEAHIPSIATPDPPIVASDSPIDFFMQPPDILDLFLVHPLMNRWKMNRLKTRYLTLSLGPLLLLCMRILHKTFHLIT